MDPIKEAFLKIKEDILFLKEEISQLKLQVKNAQITPTHNTLPTHQHTNTPTPFQAIPTHKHRVETPYAPNIDSSIGNNGVPTDKQTNRQTFQQTHFIPNSDFEQASNILSSLDDIKKGIRFKFKRLTPQEMLVFSVLYGLEEQKIKEITYRTLATQIRLSESSIRDYINKLINKGIPIEKIRQNNKTIMLKISQDLKKVVTLATIQNLRSL